MAAKRKAPAKSTRKSPTVADSSKTFNQRPKNDPLSGVVSSGTAVLPTFFEAASGSYETYEAMNRHPTVALVKSIVYSPIIGNDWNYLTPEDEKNKNKKSTTIQKTVIQRAFDRMRIQLKSHMLRGVDMGNQCFEVIWCHDEDGWLVPRFKPLKQKYTKFIVDEHGNITGLENHPPGRPKTILKSPYWFAFVYDEQPGDPYGRSRHENIRQRWSEAEELAQKTGSYVKKISNVIPVVKFPLGSGKNSSGAELGNQMLAVATADAVAKGLPQAIPNLGISPDSCNILQKNGNIDLDALLKLGELAGKSLWEISIIDPGHTDYSTGFNTILHAWDTYLFSGWLRPPRVGLESTHGSRGGEKTHKESGVLDSEILDLQIAECLNVGPWGMGDCSPIQNILRFNWGDNMIDAVRIVPPPISEDQQDLYQKILLQVIMAQKGCVPIDVAQLCEDQGIPTMDHDWNPPAALQGGAPGNNDPLKRRQDASRKPLNGNGAKH